MNSAREFWAKSFSQNSRADILLHFRRLSFQWNDPAVSENFDCTGGTVISASNRIREMIHPCITVPILMRDSQSQPVGTSGDDCTDVEFSISVFTHDLLRIE
jgi:hypothetical protein